MLNKRFQVNLSLRDKVNYILDLKGQIKIGDMAKEFGVSRQALHKSFKQNLLHIFKLKRSVSKLGQGQSYIIGEEKNLIFTNRMALPVTSRDLRDMKLFC